MAHDQSPADLDLLWGPMAEAAVFCIEQGFPHTQYTGIIGEGVKMKV